MFGFSMAIYLAIILICAVWLYITLKEDWEIGAVISAILGIIIFIVFVLSVIMIPVERQDNIAKVEYVKQLQITLDEHREKDYSSFERALVIDEINSCNYTIANWKTKNDHWWQNKWLYPPEIKEVDYVH